MMRAQLPFLTLIAAFAALSYVLVIAPLSQWRADAIAGLASVQQERVQLTQSIARLEAERESYAREDLSGLMWEASQIAQATARVQSALNDIARRNGIPVRSIAPTNAQGATSENTITFRLEFEASLDQLVPFLKTVEFDQPVLVVTRANMRRLTRPGDSGPQPDLFVQLDITAPVSLADGSQG